MKTSLRQYALALYELTEGKNREELDEILNNFINEIIDAGLSSRLDLILDKFSEIWNEEKGEIEVQVNSARTLDQKEKEMIIEFVKAKTKAEKIKIKNEVEESLLGGFKIEYQGKVLNFSFQEKLKQLKIALNKE